MLKIGDKLPNTTLYEYIPPEGEKPAIGPAAVELHAALAGKTIVWVSVPGAFTPVCSQKHLPGYIEDAHALKNAGADEVWCVAVNDAFVMGTWGWAQQVEGKLRMLADGNADFARACGLTLDLSARGMGLRANRYSMIVRDGTVVALNVEEPGQFAVSDSKTLLAQLQNMKNAK